jgi:hypothetical protein
VYAAVVTIGSDAQTERVQQWHRFAILKICEV